MKDGGSKGPGWRKKLERQAKRQAKRRRREATAVAARAKPVPLTATNKVGRNDPCRCGSGVKYKRCCADRPLCSVKDCNARVEYFLSPSFEGQRTGSHYWVACADHHEAVAAGAAREGMDVDVVSFDSIEGEAISAGGLQPVEASE